MQTVLKLFLTDAHRRGGDGWILVRLPSTNAASYVRIPATLFKALRWQAGILILVKKLKAVSSFGCRVTLSHV
jgi:hypothetical protein